MKSMKAVGRVGLFVICRKVRKYQRQVVLSVGTESTLVPLARMDEFPRLPGHPFLPAVE
jgi:hypothetical protein